MFGSKPPATGARLQVLLSSIDSGSKGSKSTCNLSGLYSCHKPAQCQVARPCQVGEGFILRSGTRDMRSCTLSGQILGSGRAASVFQRGSQRFQAPGRRLGSFPSQRRAATCGGANLPSTGHSANLSVRQTQPWRHLCWSRKLRHFLRKTILPGICCEKYWTLFCL